MARGSQSYRGRRQGGSPFLKGLVILLAVLLVLALGLTVYLGRYVQYTDEGPKLRLPWTLEPADSTPMPEVTDLIIQGGVTPDGGEEEAEPTPEPTDPVPTLSVLRALEVDSGEITGGAAAARCESAGADALVVRVKDEEGNLAWQSGLELAQEEMNGDPAFNTAVQALSRSGELYLVARVTGFQDLWTSVYVRETAITSSTGKLWYDTTGYSWMSLSHERSRDYLAGLCAELAQLGFDEILLEHAGWPDTGRVSNIAVGENYPAQGRDALASAWLEELSAALAAAGARLSVQPAETKPDDGTVSGLTPAALSHVSGRVWLREKAEVTVWQEALESAGMAELPVRLVLTESAAQKQEWTGSRVLSG